MALGRKMLLLAAFCGLAWSQTGLTTIQDTLYKADGTRFNGTLTINWSTFDATNIGTIVQQSRTAQVVNGNLLVQLVPNATATPPAKVYTVNYQSDGNRQARAAEAERPGIRRRSLNRPSWDCRRISRNAR